MIRVLTQPRKIFLGRVETLIITKFQNFHEPYEYLNIKILKNFLGPRECPNHKKKFLDGVETLAKRIILEAKWFPIKSSFIHCHVGSDKSSSRKLSFFKFSLRADPLDLSYKLYHKI